MTFLVDAIYENGVFRPLEPVAMKENQRVALHVESVPQEDARTWINRVGESRRAMAAKHGIFPDSTLDIAEDRAR